MFQKSSVFFGEVRATTSIFTAYQKIFGTLYNMPVNSFAGSLGKQISQYGPDVRVCQPHHGARRRLRRVCE
jgi:hypothetical protein